MKRRTKKLLIVLVLAPALLAGAGYGAYSYRQAKIVRTSKESYVRGKAAYDAGDHAQALPLLARYIARHRNDPDALVMLADCRARIPKPDGGEIVEAARYADHAIAIDPTHMPALELLLDLYSRLGFVTELNGVCDLILKQRPDHRGAVRAKTQSLMALGRYDDARQMADRLAEVDPASSDPFRVMLEIRRLQGGSPSEVVQQASAIVEQHPRSFELRVVYAQTLMNAADVSGAARALVEAAKLEPRTLRSIDDATRLADAIAMMQRVAEPNAVSEGQGQQQAIARGILERAVQNPDLLPGVAVLAAAWEWRRAQLPEAVAWIERGLAVAPSDPAMLGWQAMFRRDRREDWQADIAIVRTAEAGTTKLWSTLLTAIADADAGRRQQARTGTAEAMSQSERVLASAQSNMSLDVERDRISASHVQSLALLHAGNIESEMGDWRLAVQRWTRASEIEPGWSLPIVTAANVLLDHGQVRSAFDLAIRAFGVRPGPYEAITLVRTAIVRQEIEGLELDASTSMLALLGELEAMDQLRADAIALRIRAAVARRDQRAVTTAIADILAVQPAAPGALLADAAQRVRSASMTGWEPLLEAAAQGGASAAVTIMRANESADAGRRDEALLTLRQAAAGETGDAKLAYRFAEARLLARFDATDDARRILRSISDDHANSAAVQSDVLQSPVAWTEASLVELVVQRLKQATGEAGIEWKLADATRQLTFSPDPAKAQEVVIRLNHIIRDDPRNAHALTLLSDWMIVLDDTNAAVGYLSRAIDTADAPPSLYPKLIDLLRRAGRQEDARARLLAFAEVRALDVPLRRVRARLLTEFSMLPQALQDLDVLAREGSDDDRLAFAEALVRQRDYARAVNVLVPMLESDRLPRDRKVAAFALLIDAGETDRGLAMFDQSANAAGSRLTPADRARLLEHARRWEQAELAFVELAQRLNTAEAWADLARYYQRRGLPQKTRQTVASARERGVRGQELDGIEALALAATDSSLTEQQMTAVIEAIPPGAARDLAEATRWFDANPDKPEEFIARLRTITTADPQLQLAWQFLVQTLSETGEVEQAIQAARAAAASLPGSEVAARMEATTLLGADRVSEARIAATRWRQLAADPFDADILRSRIELLDGRRESALAILQPIASNAVSRVAELNLPQWAALVAAVAASGDVDRAMSLASLRDKEEPGWIQIQAAIAGENAEPPAAARAWLATISTDLVSKPHGVMTLAQAYASLAGRTRDPQDFELALATIMPEITAGTAPAFGIALAAGMLDELSRYSEAVAMYQAALRKDPELWIALNNLAYLAVERQVAGLDPITMARNAFDIAMRQRAPKSVLAQVLHTVCLAELAAQRGPAALETARRGMALDPASGALRIAEIESLIATGDTARAKSAFADLTRRVEAGLVKVDAKEQSRLTTLRETLGG